MWRRVRLYGLGFAVGLLMVFGMLMDDGCGLDGYMPQGRIMNDLAKHKLVVSDYMDCMLKCHEIQEYDISFLLTEGSVNISESNPRGEPRDYVLEATTNTGKDLSIRFQLADSTKAPIEILRPYKGTSCNCPK